MMVTRPSLIIALNIAWKLPRPLNGPSKTITCTPGARLMTASMSSSTSDSSAPCAAGDMNLRELRELASLADEVQEVLHIQGMEVVEFEQANRLARAGCRRVF